MNPLFVMPMPLRVELCCSTPRSPRRQSCGSDSAGKKLLQHCFSLQILGPVPQPVFFAVFRSSSFVAFCGPEYFRRLVPSG